MACKSGVFEHQNGNVTFYLDNNSPPLHKIVNKYRYSKTGQNSSVGTIHSKLSFQKLFSVCDHCTVYSFLNLDTNKYTCNWNFRQFVTFVSYEDFSWIWKVAKTIIHICKHQLPIEFSLESDGNISKKIGAQKASQKTFAYLLTHQFILSSKFGEPESGITSTTTLAKSSSVVAVIGWHYAPETFKMWS